MEEQNGQGYSFTDMVNLIKSFLVYQRKRWWMLLLAMVIGAALGAIYYHIQKPKYVAVTTFILEEKSSGGGGLAGLASQFGFDIASVSGGGSIFAGDNILDILRSKKVVTQVLLSNLDSNKNHSQTLADLYLQFTGKKELWKKDELLSNINFSVTNQLNPFQDSILNTIYTSIIKRNLTVDRTNKKGTIIRVVVTASNDFFARIMAERLVEEASKLYLTIKTGTALANINRMQRRSDSLLQLLNNKSFSAAASQPLDANPGLKTGIVPSEIAMRDKSVITALYTEVTKNLEASKMLLSQQAPVIQVLDTPGMLLDSNKKGLIYLLAVAGCIAVVITVFVLGTAFLLSKL